MDYISICSSYCVGTDDELSVRARRFDFFGRINTKNYPDCGCMLMAEQRLHDEIETKAKSLCPYIFIDRDASGDLRPHLLPGGETYLCAMGVAQEELWTLEADFAEFCELLGDFQSIAEMADKLYTEQRKIRISRRIAAYVHRKGLEMYANCDPQRFYGCDFVRWNERWAEGVQRDLEPIIEDLALRLARTREILARYN